MTSEQGVWTDEFDRSKPLGDAWRVDGERIGRTTYAMLHVTVDGIEYRTDEIAIHEDQLLAVERLHGASPTAVVFGPEDHEEVARYPLHAAR